MIVPDDIEARLTRNRIEGWRQAILAPLRPAMAGPERPPMSERAAARKAAEEATKAAAKAAVEAVREARRKDRARVQALKELRKFCRSEIEQGHPLPEGVRDIAANIGIRLLISNDPQGELARILCTDAKSGRPVADKTIQIAVLALGLLRRAKAKNEAQIEAGGKAKPETELRAEVFSRVGDRVGLSEEAVRDLFDRHKKQASEAREDRQLRRIDHVHCRRFDEKVK